MWTKTQFRSSLPALPCAVAVVAALIDYRRLDSYDKPVEVASVNILRTMNLTRFLAVFAILSVAAFGQQPSQRDSESAITLHGGSGSQLLQQCEAALKIGTGTKMLKMTDMQEALSGSYCRGYVHGIVDAMTVMSVNVTTTDYCIPANTDSDQLIRIAVKYLNDNPAKLHYPSGALVVGAITEAFPCKGK